MKRSAILILLTSLPLFAQSPNTSVSKDPTAVAVLNQCITASGGSVTTASIGDITATGSITYNWGKSPVQGTVTIRARGLDQIRLDSVLPAGTKSWAVASPDSAAAKDTDGTAASIPIHDAITLSGLTLPILSLYAALTDPATSIQNITPSQSSNVVIRVTRSIPLGDSFLTDSRDFYIDGNTFLVAKVLSKTHPVQTMSSDYSREVVYGDYRTVNGVAVAFSITEKIVGQQTYFVTINSVFFNSGLTSKDFTL